MGTYARPGPVSGSSCCWAGPYFDVAPTWRNGKRGGSGTRYPWEGVCEFESHRGHVKVKKNNLPKPLKCIEDSMTPGKMIRFNDLAFPPNGAVVGRARPRAAPRGLPSLPAGFCGPWPNRPTALGAP